MREVGGLIAEVLDQLATDPARADSVAGSVRRRVAALTSRFPLYEWKQAALTAG
jgi:hypothetical protein